MSVYDKIFHKNALAVVKLMVCDTEDVDFQKFAIKSYFNAMPNVAEETVSLYDSLKYEEGYEKCILAHYGKTVKYKGVKVSIQNVMARLFRWPDLCLTEELTPEVYCEHSVERHRKKLKHICINPLHFTRMKEQFMRIVSFMDHPTQQHTSLAKEFVEDILPARNGSDWMRVHYYEQNVLLKIFSSKERTMVVDWMRKKSESPGRMNLRGLTNPSRPVPTTFLLRTLYTGISFHISPEGVIIFNSTPKTLRVHFEGASKLGSDVSFFLKPHKRTIIFWAPALINFLHEHFQSGHQNEELEDFTTFYISFIHDQVDFDDNGCFERSPCWVKCEALYLKQWLRDRTPG